MSTYAQWRTAADRGDVRRTTYVCGDQRILVEEVVDTIRYLLKLSDLDHLTHHAGGRSSDREFWAAAQQHPLNPGANRLVVVRNAEQVTNWTPLGNWLASGRVLANNHLLFVSNDPDLSKDRKQTPAHIAELKAPKSHTIRCSMPNPEDARAWVRRRATLDPETAEYLLTRVGGDLTQAAAVCAKLSLFDGMAGRSTIDHLCTQAAADTFGECLLHLDKVSALIAAEQSGDKDAGRVIGLLDSRLDVLDQLHRAVRAGYKTREVQGLPYFLVKQYWPVAKWYDPDAVDRRRKLLTLADQALRGGARVGVLETIVALW